MCCLTIYHNMSSSSPLYPWLFESCQSFWWKAHKLQPSIAVVITRDKWESELVYIAVWHLTAGDGLWRTYRTVTWAAGRRKVAGFLSITGAFLSCSVGGCDIQNFGITPINHIVYEAEPGFDPDEMSFCCQSLPKYRAFTFPILPRHATSVRHIGDATDPTVRQPSTLHWERHSTDPHSYSTPRR